MFKVSNTGLGKFYSGCTYRYPMYRQWRLKFEPAHFKFGNEVHHYMEHGLDPDKELTLPYEVARKMYKIVENRGYEILAKEVDFIARLTDDIEVVGIIDAVARVNGNPVLIDWKTGARQWKMYRDGDDEVVPRREGFQGPIYTTKPYEDPYFDGEWPDELHYFMVPKDGLTKIHIYKDNPIDRFNLIQACEYMKVAADNDFYPKNKGYECEDCDFQKVCWGLPGWEKYYEKKS